MKIFKISNLLVFVVLIAVVMFTLSGCFAAEISESGSRDRALVGKWRSKKGGTVELNSDGSGYTSVFNPKDDLLLWSKYSKTVKHTVGDPVWSSENGQLTFTVEHIESFEVKYHSEKDEIHANDYSSSYNMTRKEDTDNTGGYIGTWITTAGWKITLNDDGTGHITSSALSNVFGGKSIDTDIEWEIEETNESHWTIERLYMTYIVSTTFDYYISDDKLTLFTSDSSEDFVKITD